MRLISLLIGIVVFFAVASAVLWYVRPQSFAWLGWHDAKNVGDVFVVKYQEGSPSIRVGNGRIVPQEQYELSFPFSGKAESILVSEGQSFVESGQPLVQLEKTEWLLELKKAEAEYAAEQAIVNKLREGARFEELVIAEQKKQSSESSLKGSKREVMDAIAHAFVQADDAVRNKTDDIFTNPESDPQLSFVPSDALLEAEIEAGRAAMERMLDNWEDDVHGMKTSGNISKYIDGSRNKLKDTREYLDAVAAAVNMLTAGALSQDTIDTWRDAVSVARSAVTEATVEIGAAESSYKVVNKDAAVARSELGLKLAGTQRQDIEAALSAAVAARSQMDIISEKLKQTTLSTPLKDLVLKKLFVKQGEYVEAGRPVALLVKPTLEIELDIPEEKIAGVEVGNQVIMRLNAYPYEDMKGVITEIRSQEIEKDGGIYFRVRASLENASEKIRTGMTGEVIVEATVVGTVLRIPEETVRVANGRRLVTVVKDGEAQIRVIESGIVKNGQVEILSGLQSEEQILRRMQ